MSAVDDVSEESDEESVTILAQVHNNIPAVTFMLAQDVDDNTPPTLRASIGSDSVLLDRQSTVDLIINPARVQNICPAKTPMWVHCNKGSMTTIEEVDFGDTPVYFISRRIVNVLSLHRLGKKFCVTYDSFNCDGVFQVHTTKGTVKFKPTPKGLYALSLKANPKAAHLLVNDADL